jgi:SnoaL-like domain
MSQENVEIVRRLYRAMNAWDREAFAELADPDSEWIPDSRVGEGPVRGRENVIRFFTDRAEMFNEVRTDPGAVLGEGRQGRRLPPGEGARAGVACRVPLPLRVARWVFPSPSALRADASAEGDTKEERRMAKTITPDQVIRAARDLAQSEFTRDDLAGKLGVGKPKFKQAFKTARQSGQLEKVRDDADRKGRFRVTESERGK